MDIRGVETLVHALGATHQIPHGITSCLTLVPVLQCEGRTNLGEAN